MIEHEPVQAPAQPSEADILRRAADLLEEFGWLQGSYAADANGEPCSCTASEAVSFCLMGAITRSCRDLDSRRGNILFTLGAERDVRAILLRRGGPLSVMGWNDHPRRTKEEVVGLLREAALAAAERA